MDDARLLLVTDGSSLPLRVAEGAATLPTLYSIDSAQMDGARKIAVAVGTIVPLSDDVTGVLLLHPTLVAAAADTRNLPTVVCDRWSGNEILTSFIEVFGPSVARSEFIYFRATVPADDKTDMRSELLGAILALERVGINSLGHIDNVIVDGRHASVAARTVMADSKCVVHMSIVASNAEAPNLRLDFYGAGEIATVVVPDRGAGSVTGSAYRVSNDGEEALPSIYSDPIRTALLKLQSLVERGEVGEDIHRLTRSLVETRRVLDAGN
jgi:hypothetical protein